MRLAVSNIGWDVSHDEAMAELLNSYGVDAIDIAPGKYFPDPLNATDTEIEKVRQWWAQRGIEITGMQALLFGTTGLNVFGSSQVQDKMLQHLAAVCRIGAGLGATKLVFGSPRNRDKSGLTDLQTMETAVDFFRRLGDIASSYGVLVCLEPSPTCYGANFMTCGSDTAKVVTEVDHQAIKMQLDTGAVTINNEDPADQLRRFSHLIGHVHISEPELLPPGDGSTEHDKVYDAMVKYLPDRLLTIEMLAINSESNIQSVERAIKLVSVKYRLNLPGITP